MGVILGYIGGILGLCWGDIGLVVVFSGIMESKMETTIMG